MLTSARHPAPRHLRNALLRVAASLVLAASSSLASAQAYTEGFDNITSLVGNGWFQQNNSQPLGANPVWFQGTPTNATPDPGPFNAFTGADNSYIAANFASTAGGTGTISNWLLTPNRTLRNGDVFSFYTRKPTIGPGQTDFPDRLEVRLSTNGASTNVGTTATATGDFITLLVSINPTLVTNVYPQTWTRYTITISGLPAPTSGRIAFRYFVTSAGPTGTNSDYIGVDQTVYTPYVCPVLTIGGTPPGADFGQAYSSSLSQTGALGAPSYAITAGALPPGLSLSAGGTISGTPTAAGTFNFTATVADASGCSASRVLSIVVAQASQVLTFPAQTVASRFLDAGSTFPIDPLASSVAPNSGQPIVYSSLDSGVCTVSETTVTMVAEGMCTIAADQAGDGNFAAAARVTSTVMLTLPTEADLWIEKTVSSPTVRIGDTVVYTIVVGNDGPADAVNVSVLDTPPSRLSPAAVVWECVEAVGTACPDPDSDVGELDAVIASLPEGATVTFELMGTVIAAADPGENFTAFDNTASVALPQGSTLTDPVPASNQSTASVLVLALSVFEDGFESP